MKAHQGWCFAIAVMLFLIITSGLGIYRLIICERIEDRFENQFDNYAYISIEKMSGIGSTSKYPYKAKMELVERESLNYFALCLSQRKVNVERIKHDENWMQNSSFCYWTLYVEEHPIEFAVYIPNQKKIDHVVIGYPINQLSDGKYYSIYLPEPRPEGFQEFLTRASK